MAKQVPADDTAITAVVDAAPRVESYTSRAGIGWRCTRCTSTWSGARTAHTPDQCYPTPRVGYAAARDTS